jgi:hypothetical protein
MLRSLTERYVSYLHSKHLKASSIRSHLSAIAFMYELSGYVNSTRSFLVRKLLRSYSKSDSAPASRKPITKSILRTCIYAIKRFSNNQYDRRLYTSLATCMYHAALRVSEVCVTPRSRHTLQFSQIRLVTSRNKKYLRISFSSYKHSQFHIKCLLLY